MSGNPFEELAQLVTARLDADPPHVVGIAGAVAVGKSSVAGSLAGELRETGRKVDVISTDAFLRSNAELDEMGIAFRKGFPESFHLDALTGVLDGLKKGSAVIVLPVYSHVTYDLVPDAHTQIGDPDIAIVEGVVVLQPSVAELLDVSIYVDAEESDVRRWFVERFLRLTEEARSDTGSFYRGFVDMPEDQLKSLAEATWDGINGANLREHILPTRDRAEIVVEKAGDHSVRRVIDRGLS